MRHWPRSHAKDGASAYRLDWEEAGLSVVWTGDGRPDEKTAKYAKGCDVFITEGQFDALKLQEYKFGIPQHLIEYTVDTYHTPYYAAGYLMKQVQPRAGVICHYEHNQENESIAEIRTHWPGLFIWGGPDVQVINVTKDRIWSREALRPHHASISPPDFRDLFPAGQVPDKIVIPAPRLPREKQQEAFLREMEIDGSKYYPEDVARPFTQSWPEEGFALDIKKMIEARGGATEGK